MSDRLDEAEAIVAKCESKFGNGRNHLINHIVWLMEERDHYREALQTIYENTSNKAIAEEALKNRGYK